MSLFKKRDVGGLFGKKQTARKSSGDIIGAVSGHDVQAVSDYIEVGGDLDKKDQWGNTPLILAGHFGYTDIVKVLIEAKAMIDAKDTNAQTVLMKACDKGRDDIVGLLIANRADVDLVDVRGQTALIMAAQNGHAAIVKMLLDAGANAAVKDNEGMTALTWAKHENHPAVVDVLNAQTDEARRTLSDKTVESLQQDISQTESAMASLKDRIASEEREAVRSAAASRNDADLANVMIGQIKEDMGLAPPGASVGTTRLRQQYDVLENRLNTLRQELDEREKKESRG